jgi:hypothetical protein
MAMVNLTSHLTDLIVTVIVSVPWLVLAGVAAFVYFKRKGSRMVLVQAAGAAGMFVLPLFQWLLVLVMSMIGFSYDIMNAERIIYRFMLFVMLCVFAAGYALERWKKRELPGFPVQP